MGCFDRKIGFQAGLTVKKVYFGVDIQNAIYYFIYIVSMDIWRLRRGVVLHYPKKVTLSKRKPV